MIHGVVDSADNFTDEAITASKRTNGQMIEKSLEVLILSPYLFLVPFYNDYLGNKLHTVAFSLNLELLLTHNMA